MELILLFIAILILFPILGYFVVLIIEFIEDIGDDRR